ncbi:MAG: 50S ribosomal protein L4 [Candidatus Omnitrophica bacterium]|nr:50S ribosomal protein L4 [Candidatus Omnitrophota bacterium]
MANKETTKKEAVKKDITKIPVYSLEGKVVDSMQLDKEVFDGRVNKTLIYEANRMYEACKRRGTASTKTQSEVSGGGVKPWKQKGTGRARAGSIRSPLWRHGGTLFGPKPRSFKYTMPQKAVTGALISILNARLNEEKIKGIVKIDLKEAKTKEFKKIYDNLKLDGRALFICASISKELKRASRNMGNVMMIEARNLNTRDVLLNEDVFLEKGAAEKIVERLK